jgi:hypothetical protein
MRRVRVYRPPCRRKKRRHPRSIIGAALVTCGARPNDNQRAGEEADGDCVQRPGWSASEIGYLGRSQRLTLLLPNALTANEHAIS